MNKNKKKIKQTSTLIIQGPNMNLLGLRLKETKTTLDKLNAYLRRTARDFEIQIIIFQTNDESKAVAKIQKYRNKINNLLLFPGPWQQSGYVLKDTLELVNIPFITISLRENMNLLRGLDNIEGDIFKASKKALEQLTNLV